MCRTFLVALLVVLPSFTSGAEPPVHRTNGDLAIQARDILQRRCAGCHTGSPDVGKSKLNVLKHEQLTAKRNTVPFVAPGGRSQLLELLKDGSMPPANREPPSAAEIAILEKWVQAGAPAYPQAFDERYVLDAVADDFERENAKIKDRTAGEYLRYASFAHLVRDSQAPPDLVAAEARLNEALSRAVGGAPVKVIPIDPAATVFRIELNRLGWWTRDLFERVEAGKPAGADRLRPFDLILLEYSHASALPPGDPTGSRLEKLLSPKSQVRPVPYLRGDWLAAALVNGKTLTPLAEDISSLARLEMSRASDQPAPKGPPVPRRFGTAPALVGPASAEGRAPILPLSGWYAGDVTPDSAPFGLTAELIVEDQPVKAVTTEQSFKLRVWADRRVHLSLLWVQADGEPIVQDLGGASVLQVKVTRDLTPKNNPNGFDIAGIITGGDSATEYFVLFASEVPLPDPVIVRSTHAGLPVWRFLLEPTEKKPFDPNKVVRKVVPIPVTRKKGG